MTNLSFPSWRETPENLKFTQNHILQPEGSKWGRVICKWNEKTFPKGVTDREKVEVIEHTYAAAINLESGKIYLDCRKRKIWFKCCLYSLIQPLILTSKTVYHLALPFSIPYEIYQTVQTARDENPKISTKELAKKSIIQVGKNFADIIRTPVYGVALLIISLAGVIIGPLAPRILYDIRSMIGKVEKALNWGDQYSSWILFNCFQPLDNLMSIQWRNRNQPDTLYITENSGLNPTLKGLTNFARTMIKFRRENRALFNDCCQKYPENKPYRSLSTPS